MGLKRNDAAFGDDDVIVKGNVYALGCVPNGSGHLDVGLRRRRISRWVIVDENDGAGWDLLRQLCFARERASENKNELTVLTARGLLSNQIFTSRW